MVPSRLSSPNFTDKETQRWWLSHPTRWSEDQNLILGNFCSTSHSWRIYFTPGRWILSIPSTNNVHSYCPCSSSFSCPVCLLVLLHRSKSYLSFETSSYSILHDLLLLWKSYVLNKMLEEEDHCSLLGQIKCTLTLSTKQSYLDDFFPENYSLFTHSFLLCFRKWFQERLSHIAPS